MLLRAGQKGAKNKIAATSTLTRFRFNVVTKKRKESDSYKNMHSDPRTNHHHMTASNSKARNQ